MIIVEDGGQTISTMPLNLEEIPNHAGNEGGTATNQATTQDSFSPESKH
jgi:hypothetical protein